MKECSGEKVLIVKVAQNEPHGVVLHVQKEVDQSILTFRRRVAKYQE